MNGREAMGRLAQRVKASMGRYRLVWLVILAGLILLLLPTGEKEGEAREETEQTQSAFDLAATEARLSQALSKIHGAGEVTVVLTVANGPRQILAENVDRDGSQGEEKTETVVLSRGSGSQASINSFNRIISCVTARSVDGISCTAVSGMLHCASARCRLFSIARLEKIASLPPFKITAFPALKHRPNASAVTLGRDS